MPTVAAMTGEDDVGELHATAEVLGHSPDLLLRTDAHTVPCEPLARVSMVDAEGVSKRGCDGRARS